MPEGDGPEGDARRRGPKAMPEGDKPEGEALRRGSKARPEGEAPHRIMKPKTLDWTTAGPKARRKQELEVEDIVVGRRVAVARAGLRRLVWRWRPEANKFGTCKRRRGRKPEGGGQADENTGTKSVARAG